MEHFNLNAIEVAFSKTATDATRWAQALESLTEHTGSFGAILFPITGRPDFQMPSTERMSASIEAYFKDGWHQRDERFKGAATMMAAGIVDDFDILRADNMKRHAYYQEFLARFGLKWFAGLKIGVGDDVWCLSLQRSPDQGPFSSNEKQLLLRLTQSISASAAVSQAIGIGTAKGALDAFEATRKAAVLVDSLGDVVQINASAEALLGHELKIVGRQFVSPDRAAIHDLKAAIRNLLVDRPASVPLPVAFPRAYRRPILAYPMRLDRSASYFFANCRVFVTLVDLEQTMQVGEHQLRTLFLMTKTEARLAARLTSGKSLETVADEFGISKETARRHLQSIFNKAGVNRQTELIALLARLF